MIAFFLSFIVGVLIGFLLFPTIYGLWLKYRHRNLRLIERYPIMNQRGVSQILATILLIGMTIVLIAVLYALILPMFDIDTTMPWD